MKNNKPEIRFKGFSEEWVEKKLGDVANLENGFAFKSEFFKDEPTDAILLTPGNVNIGGGFQEGKGRFYDMSGNFPKKFILKPEDIFVTMTDLTPTGQTLGLPAVVPNDGNIYLHNQRLGKMTDFKGDKSFLFQLLSSEQIHRQIVQTASGTTVKHSSPQRILNCLNYFPSKNEQTQIGNFFKNLDNLISLHQRKYEKLGILKKAMLEKMFPKNGADVPEIRFKGFSGAWEEKTLGEICVIGDIDHRMPESVTDGIPYIMTGSFTGINDIDFKDSKLISTEDYEQLAKKIKPEMGDILFARYASVGAVRYVETQMKFLVSYSCAILKNNSTFNSKYLFYYLQSKETQRQIELEINTGSQRNIGIDSLKKLNIFIPQDTEQAKIGNYFKNLDNLLTLHRGELEKLQHLKKALLEKMFV